MKRSLTTSVFLLLLLFAVPAGEGRKPAQANSAKASSDSEALYAEAKKFLAYMQDFVDMQKAYINEHADYDTAGTLHEVAGHNVERLGFLASLIIVYEGIAP